MAFLNRFTFLKFLNLPLVPNHMISSKIVSEENFVSTEGYGPSLSSDPQPYFVRTGWMDIVCLVTLNPTM